MRISRSIIAACFPAVLSGGVLLFAGCGSEQTDGQLVTETEEVKQSRAAIQKQTEQNPNLYAPQKNRRR